MGRDEEFTAYAAGRWRLLVRSAVLLGCAVPEAEDLAQATLLRCYVKWGAVSGSEHRDAYVARIMLNLHRQSRRRRWWGERPTSELPEVVEPDPTEGVLQSDAVRRALDSLAPAQREVVVLRYFVHLTEAQVADALRIPPGTVKSRLSRALARLSESPELALELGDRT